MKILQIKVDEIPKSCGDCFLMRYRGDVTPICCALPDDDFINEIAGNPYDMNYRRSDCPLESEETQ